MYQVKEHLGNHLAARDVHISEFSSSLSRCVTLQEFPCKSLKRQTKDHWYITYNKEEWRLISTVGD